MEPAGKLTFTLTYEELLKRVNSKYEYILHIQPGQIVKDYQADIYLNESLPLRSIHVPELKTNPNDITSELNPSSIATVERNIDGDSNRAHIVFKPDVQYQKLAAKSLVSFLPLCTAHADSLILYKLQNEYRNDEYSY